MRLKAWSDRQVRTDPKFALALVREQGREIDRLWKLMARIQRVIRQEIQK